MKVSLIVLMALAALPLLRRRSAALRHWVLAAAIVCAAMTPVLERLLPVWRVDVGPVAPAPLTPAAPRTTAPPRVQPPTAAAVKPPPADRGDAPPFQWIDRGGLRAIWFAGFAAGLIVLSAGVARLAWIASRARTLASGRWVELADDIRRECGIARPVSLLHSHHPSLLVTWGTVRPRIVLPADALTWPEGRIRMVLYHELAHIVRADWVAQIAAAVLRAMHWFNPIVWIACRRLRLESERACDDAVMRRGVEGAEYAAQLLDLARVLNQRRAWLPAPAMARPSSLERRVSAMLNDGLDRHPVSRRARAATLAALLMLTIGLAAAQTFSALSGTLVDPLGGLLPGVKVTLTDARSGEKREVATSAKGAFEFVGLPQGEYRLEAALPGFMLARETLTLSASPVHRQITLQIGTLSETVTVTDGPDTGGEPVRTMAARPNPPCGPASGGGEQIGGNIRPPRKIRDVRPQYPAHLRGTGTEGVVVMDARIGLDGFVKDVQVRQPAPQADLVRAAIDAVNSWQFDSTLLNCTPMEVVMVVTVKFVHQP